MIKSLHVISRRQTKHLKQAKKKPFDQSTITGSVGGGAATSTTASAASYSNAKAGEKTPPPVPKKRNDSLLPSTRPESRPYRDGYENDVEDNYGSQLHKFG